MKVEVKVRTAWRRAALEARKTSERRALENQMALRIQTSWRGRKGRLSAHLKKQAKRARDAEEREAAMRLQSLYRGREARVELPLLRLSFPLLWPVPVPLHAPLPPPLPVPP